MHLWLLTAGLSERGTVVRHIVCTPFLTGTWISLRPNTTWRHHMRVIQPLECQIVKPSALMSGVGMKIRRLKRRDTCWIHAIKATSHSRSSWGLWPLIFFTVISVLKGRGFMYAMSVMSWNSHKYAQLVYLTAFLICTQICCFLTVFRGGFLLWLGFFFYIHLIFFYAIRHSSAIPRPHTISLLCDSSISHREGCMSSMVPLEAGRYAFTASGAPVVTAPVITSTRASKR